MSVLDETKQIFFNQLATAGRAALHAIYPDEFEYYACALELVDSKGKTLDMLVFPVMPTSISESSTGISNIKKTSAGVSVLVNSTFIPIDIDISGNFGRKFRLLAGRKEISFSAISTTNLNLTDVKNSFLSSEVKTGYGVIKVLQSICNASYTPDEYNNSKRLFFYNLALNSNYMVEVINLTLSQNRESNNMIWNYSLKLKALAPVSSIIGNQKEKSKINRILLFDNTNKFMNQSITMIKEQIPITQTPMNLGLGTLTALL